jgi:hypothetical protein
LRCGHRRAHGSQYTTFNTVTHDDGGLGGGGGMEACALDVSVQNVCVTMITHVTRIKSDIVFDRLRVCKILNIVLVYN